MNSEPSVLRELAPEICTTTGETPDLGKGHHSWDTVTLYKFEEKFSLVRLGVSPQGKHWTQSRATHLLEQIIPGHPHTRRLPGLPPAQPLSVSQRQFTHRALKSQGGMRAQPGTRFNGMRLIPVSENSGKPSVGLHPVQPPKETISVLMLWLSIYTAWYPGAISLQGRVPVIQEGPFCPSSSSNLPFTHSSSSLQVCILCSLDKADHVTPSSLKHLLL